MTAPDRYHAGSRALQDRFGTRRLADRLNERTSRDHVRDDDAAFIARMDMFFLATADADGQPQCSYRMALVERSVYVPRAGVPTPVPGWKRGPLAAGVLPPSDPAAQT